jgi:hypothetical protein
MEPLDFLAAVLPSPGNGYYCAAELSTTTKEHRYEEELQNLIPAIDGWKAKDCDIYFALGTFKKKGSREADNAQCLKSFFIDMDGYATKKAAAAELQNFLAKTGLDALGRPWFVGSGGGLHVYWPLTAEVEPAVWRPVAENFKRLCKQEGLRIDMTVTADASRVLRVPGTRNHKKKYGTPREVKFLNAGDTFTLDAIKTAIEAVLRPEYQVKVVAPLEGVRPNKSKGATQIKLLQNSVTLFENIYDRTVAGTGCGQLKAYIDNPSEDGLEPIWRGLLSWTKVCEDVDAWAPWLSDLHPYSEQRMNQKLAEIKGPYPCTKMDSENPGICGNCPHFGKITNPLVFGREIKTDDTEKIIPIAPLSEATPMSMLDESEFDGLDAEELELDGVAGQTPHQVIKRPQPPKGFSYGQNGGIYCTKMVEDDDGTKTKKQVQVLPYDLFVVDILEQENDYLAHLVALRPDGPKNITMPTKAVVSKDETVKFLASQNVIASFGKNNDNNLFDYVRAAVEEASTSKRAVLIPQQCGWQKDGSFVYNYRVFTRDGREISVPMPGLENINARTMGKGNIEEWRQPWQLVIQRKNYTMLALMVDSFGCPLMHFTDYEGFVWHIGSTESGTGKSLALSFKAGVWGHPLRYRTGKGTSPVAMQQRAGLLNSLPLLIDEITAKAREDFEWAPAFIFDVSEGQGKERMESGANRERVNNSVWKLTCTMTSNTHLTDYMSGARKHSSNGELLRMLEWTPTQPLQWTDEERAVLRKIKDHYGVAGEKWVRWLVRNQDTAAQVVRDVHERLKEEFSFTDDERYWHTGCTVIIAAGILMGPRYADILAVPVKGIMGALKELVIRGRGVMRRAVRSAEDVLNAYTRDNYGGFVAVVKAEGRGILASWGSGETVDKSITRTRVLGRIERDTIQEGYTEMFIEEQLLRQHCVSMSYGYADFKAQLEKQFRVTYCKKNMMQGTNGPVMRVNVMHISRRTAEIDEADLPLVEAQAG